MNVRTKNNRWVARKSLVGITDPLNRVVSYTHDEGGRVLRVTEPDPDGTGPASAAYREYGLDALGNLLSQSDALGNTDNFTLDAWFRVLTQVDPDGGLTGIEYDVFGNTVSVTDPLNNVTSYVYNKLNQVVAEGKGSVDRTFSYDGVENLRSAVDRNDRLTQWEYDAVGNRTLLEANIGGSIVGGAIGGGVVGFFAGSKAGENYYEFFFEPGMLME